MNYENSDKTVVIYHANCSDGFCAAYVVNRYAGLDKAIYYPYNHSQLPPDVTGKDVIILDFSFSKVVLQSMIDTANSVLLLDHHKSAVEDLAGMPNCHFDMTRSGAGMAWDYFVKGPRHWVVDYVEDRDLWNWKYAYGKGVSIVIHMYEKTFEEWDKLFARDISEVKGMGSMLESYQLSMVKDIAKMAIDTDLDGYPAKIVNSTIHISEVGGMLAEQSKVGIVWSLISGVVRISLRSRGPEVDVATIAKKYGGGGHFNAAGFSLSIPDFITKFNLSKITE